MFVMIKDGKVKFESSISPEKRMDHEIIVQVDLGDEDGTLEAICVKNELGAIPEPSVFVVD